MSICRHISVTIYKENMGFSAGFFVIPIISLNKFAYKNVILLVLLKKK